MGLNRSAVEAALASFIDPNSGKSLLAAAEVSNVGVNGSLISADVRLGYPAASQKDTFRQTLEEHVAAELGVALLSLKFAINVSSNVVMHASQRGTEPLPNVKNVIAVASGKGGVGKSTTAVNLALALAAEGAVVGILDADIYGPSLPMMLGVDAKPQSVDGKSMEPLTNHGVQAISIGFLIDRDEPMVWRGPMVTQALMQLLTQTNWHAVDYLIVDMPPGTGDIQLTLSQKVPVTGAVIVTTPQDIALLDARKGLRMFEKVGIPILGVIENMSVHVCSNCGHSEAIFGSGGAEKLCAQYSVDFLGGLPLDMRIREQTDAGTPTVVAEPSGPIAKAYRDIAVRIAARIAARPDDTAGFPTISVQDT
jgi:ATP-binding protein involved in chromosome partitioning